MTNRDRYIHDCKPLANRLASSVRKNLPDGVYEWDDLISCAYLGLCEAACSYDPAVGDFEAYAFLRIRGAIIDGLRRKGMFPRAVYEFRRRNIASKKELEMDLGREPTEDEVADAIGLSVVEYRKRKAHVSSLEGENISSDGYDKHSISEVTPDEVDYFERWSIAEDVASAMRELPDRERFVLYCVFWLGMTQQSIAEILGVNHSRVSQLKFQALGRMRCGLADYGE
jgi:RNA polymerase sigma factor FliA